MVGIDYNICNKVDCQNLRKLDEKSDIDVLIHINGVPGLFMPVCICRKVECSVLDNNQIEIPKSCEVPEDCNYRSVMIVGSSCKCDCSVCPQERSIVLQKSSLGGGDYISFDYENSQGDFVNVMAKSPMNVDFGG